MPEWLLQIVGIMAGAGGVYAAIRADLAALREKADQAALSAAEAHARIDRHLERERA